MVPKSVLKLEKKEIQQKFINFASCLALLPCMHSQAS